MLPLLVPADSPAELEPRVLSPSFPPDPAVALDVVMAEVLS
ncbi:MAG: hypothetical protein AAGF11_12850 [Myxococcota bacterium]